MITLSHLKCRGLGFVVCFVFKRSSFNISAFGLLIKKINLNFHFYYVTLYNGNLLLEKNMFPTFFLRGKLHPWEDKTGSRWEGQARAELIFCWGEEKKVPFSTQFKCKEVSVWESNSNMEIYTAIFNYCFLKTTGKKPHCFTDFLLRVWQLSS